MGPVLIVSLLAATAAAAAVAGGSAGESTGKRGTTTTTHGGGPKVQHGMPQPEAPSEGAVWSWYATGSRPQEQQKYLGQVAVGDYEASLYVFVPNVDASIRLGGKRYYYNKPPEGGSKYIEAVVKKLNEALQQTGPALEVTAASFGVPPGVASAASEVLSGVLSAIPRMIRRARVKVWTLWRQGKFGTEESKKLLSSVTARWLDANPVYATAKSTMVHRTLFNVSADGDVSYREYNPTRGKPVEPQPGYTLTGPPRLIVETGDAVMTVTVDMPPTANVPPGERRCVVVMKAV